MKRKFEQLLESYQKLLEQPAPPTPPTPVEAPVVDPAAQPVAPPQPVKKEPATIGFTVLTKLILDAFKTKKPQYHNDLKFSDNKARTPDEAFKYLEIVSRNLPPESQNKLEAGINNKGGTTADMDGLTLIDAANLAINALFYYPKLDEEESTEYNDIAQIVDVTPENAKEIYQKIRSYLSLYNKK